MLRDSVFRSGIPSIIAAICMLALAYVAVVRRERLAMYWTVAWALLVSRYSWTGFWGSPYPNEWTNFVASCMRVGFAATVLAGVLAIRGVRFSIWWIPATAIGVPLIVELLGGQLTEQQSTQVVLLVMFVFLLVAAARIVTASKLPVAERSVIATALATYAIASAVSSQLASGSPAFTRATVLAWATQLLVGISTLAMFFRLSYEAELAARKITEQRLTLALSGFMHICMHCKSVHDEGKDWQSLERFLADRTKAQLSHGLCTSCAEKHYPAEYAELSASTE